MKYLIMCVMFIPITLLSQNWDIISIENVCKFKLPPTMEIRQSGSLVDKGVQKLFSINEWTYDSNRITIQPKGLDANNKIATYLFGRIIISIEAGNKGDFSTIEKMPKTDIDLVKYLMIESFKENSKKYGIETYDITPVSINKVGKKSAFYYSYSRKSSKDGNPPVFVQVYRILNDDTAIQITLSYRQSEKSIWHTDYNTFINSIEIL